MLLFLWSEIFVNIEEGRKGKHSLQTKNFMKKGG